MTITVVPQTRAGVHRRHGSPSRARTGMRLVLQVGAWVVILVITAAVAVAVLVPRLGGATPYTILTGSMRPHLPPGTLVVVKPVDPADVGVGTVLTYQIESGKPDVVTHRVVEVSQGPDGEPRWHTRGDANGANDPEWVRPVQVKGELWYSVPFLGRVNLWLSPDQRRATGLAIALGLVGYAALMFLGAGRDRLRRRPQAVAR